MRPLAGSDTAPGPSSLPVASAQAASGAGEPGLAVRFGRAPPSPLRGSGGSGSARAAGARSSARTRTLAEHSPRALSAHPSRPRDTGLDSTDSEPCGAGRFVSFLNAATLWSFRGSAAPEDALCSGPGSVRCTPLLAGLLLLLRPLALAADLERRCRRGRLGCVERIGARFPFPKTGAYYMRCIECMHAAMHAARAQHGREEHGRGGARPGQPRAPLECLVLSLQTATTKCLRNSVAASGVARSACHSW